MDESEITERIENQHAGAADALQARVKQLYNTVIALKQHIFLLRQISETSLTGHLNSSKIITIPEELHLTENGIRPLLQQLSQANKDVATMIEAVYNSKTAFQGSITRLNDKCEEIKKSLERLCPGHKHRQIEKKVNTAANLTNQVIQNLTQSCSSAYINSPYFDPCTILQNAQSRLDEFLVLENEYKKLCLAEQNTEKRVENDVFMILQDLLLEHGEIMRALLDRCHDILAVVETRMAFESSVEWTEFEANEGGKFVPTDPQAILLTSDNHPYDEQFSQFSEIREDMLEIKQKFPQPTKDKFGDMLGKIKPRERGFAVRGIWYISSGGWFIEYTNNEVQSRFNLCKCRLGHLAPDSSEIYGHFTLRGQKQSTDKNKHPRKKDYKFRAPLDRAKALYKVLCRFCGEGQMEMQDNASNVSITSSMSGDTTVVGSD